VVPNEWFERYAHRVEEFRLPKSKTAREAYLLTVGQDGFALIDAIERDPAVTNLKALPKVEALQKVWERHYERKGERVRWHENKELSRAAFAIESPYETQARYSTKRGLQWTGYKVHVTESCDEDVPHLIMNVLSTLATQQDVSTTLAIHQALADKKRLPAEHLVDAGYVDAKLLVKMEQDYQLRLIGPPRSAKGWQSKEEGAFTAAHFTIDWEHKQASCPGGKTSSYWKPYRVAGTYPRELIAVRFSSTDCRDCALRARCTRSEKQGRVLHLYPKPQFEALNAMRDYMTTDEGRQAYALRAGIEATLSEGVRAFGLRRCRYRGEAKTHLQHVATAAAINALRATDWLAGERLQSTRTSRFARLATAA
jgi:transposase